MIDKFRKQFTKQKIQHMKKIFILAITILPLLFSSCSDDKKKVDEVIPEDKPGLNYNNNNGTINLSFAHFFGNTPLALNTNFITAAADTIRISELKYYISNIQLMNEANQWVNLKTYHLIDFSDVQSMANNLASGIPKGVYTKMRFLVGVDSAMNRAGVEDGDLSPTNEMFWSWTADYIFFRLKGRFNTANTPMSLDVGGNSNAGLVELDLTGLKKNGATTVTVPLKMDLDEVFKTPHTYDLKTMSSEIHTASNPDAGKLRDNIVQGAFSVITQ